MNGRFFGGQTIVARFVSRQVGLSPLPNAH
jgi:hypothetical protein